MISVDVTMDLKPFQRILIQASEKAKKNLELAVRYSAMAILQGARDKVPVDTGNLRGSLNIKYVFEYPNYGAIIGSNLDYAFDQEYNQNYTHAGRHQKNANAQYGFLRKSLYDEEPKFKANIDKVLGSR